jgi:hypothetical protein
MLRGPVSFTKITPGEYPTMVEAPAANLATDEFEVCNNAKTRDVTFTVNEFKALVENVADISTFDDWYRCEHELDSL